MRQLQIVTVKGQAVGFRDLGLRALSLLVPTRVSAFLQHRLRKHLCYELCENEKPHEKNMLSPLKNYLRNQEDLPESTRYDLRLRQRRKPCQHFFPPPQTLRSRLAPFRKPDAYINKCNERSRMNAQQPRTYSSAPYFLFHIPAVSAAIFDEVHDVRKWNSVAQ